MATVKPKMVGNFTITGDCISHARTDVEVRDVDVTIDEPTQRGGTQLQEEIAVPFPKIVLKIDVTTSADDSAIAKVKSDLGKFCPLAKVLREAGTEIEEIWTITHA